MFLIETIALIIGIFSPDRINTFGMVELLPAEIVSALVGLYAHKFIYSKQYLKSAYLSVAFLSYLLLSPYLLPNYYFYFYTFKTGNNQQVLNINFELSDVRKNIIKPEDLKNKVVIMEFWNPSCGYCLLQLRDMDEVVKSYRDNSNIVFLAINPSTSNSFDEFQKSKHVEEYENHLNMVYDIKSILTKEFNIDKFPVTFLIDKKGRLRNYTNGYFENIDNFTGNISYQIQKLLDE